MEAPVFVRSPLGPSARLLAVLLIGAVASACATSAGPNPAPPTPPVAAPAALPDPAQAGLMHCAPTALTVQVIGWEGAAGSRIGQIELLNSGTVACTVLALAQPQLIDGSGAVLIDGAEASPSETLVVEPGDKLETLVQASNYCGPDPAPPVAVAFVFPPEGGRVVGAPVAAGDTSGLPPCLGSAGTPGTIAMQPWTP